MIKNAYLLYISIYLRLAVSILLTGWMRQDLLIIINLLYIRKAKILLHQSGAWQEGKKKTKLKLPKLIKNFNYLIMRDYFNININNLSTRKITQNIQIPWYYNVQSNSHFDFNNLQ